VSDLHYVVYPWVVDCLVLREAGWRPAYDNEAAFRVLLEQRAGHHAVAGRRIARKEATITAAGAANQASEDRSLTQGTGGWAALGSSAFGPFTEPDLFEVAP